jgi:hypothetical protein
MGMASPDKLGDTTSRLVLVSVACSETWFPEYTSFGSNVSTDRRPAWIVGVNRWAGPAERRPIEVVRFERRAADRHKLRGKNRRRERRLTWHG